MGESSISSGQLNRRQLLALGSIGASTLALSEFIFAAEPAFADVVWNHPFAGFRGNIYAPYGPDSDYGDGMHKGTDYSGPPSAGTSVYSVASGTVTYAAWEPWAPQGTSLGYRVTIRHENGWHSNYGHLQEGSIAVNVGQVITSPTRIGKVGNTGESHGAHLHIEIWTGSSRSMHTDPVPIVHWKPLADEVQPQTQPFTTGANMFYIATNSAPNVVYCVYLDGNGSLRMRVTTANEWAYAEQAGFKKGLGDEGTLVNLAAECGYQYQVPNPKIAPSLSEIQGVVRAELDAS